MTQAMDRTTVHNRTFELASAFAGRMDDDALADVRELLAVAEVDRALGLLIGCLAAGDLPVTEQEDATLRDLARAALLDEAALAHVRVDSGAATSRQRFSAGTTAQDPRAGVLPAIDRTLDVVPGVRALHCVWRVTPAGPVPGPVPRRVLLVHVEPNGFPAAVAYRLDLALRRHGVDAAVEVVPEGATLPDYHSAALGEAREIPLRGAVASVETTATMEPITAEPPLEHPQSGSESFGSPEPAADTGSGAAFDMVDALAATPPEPPATNRSNGDRDAGATFFAETDFFSVDNHDSTGTATSRAVEPDTNGFSFAPEPDPRRDGDLNDTERDLLAQLHAELGKREREQQDTGFAEPVSDQREPDSQTNRHSAERPAVWPQEGE